MTKTIHFRVGNTAYFVSTHRHPVQKFDVTITKVGRRWAYMKGGGLQIVVDMSTGNAKPGFIEGTLYESKAVYESEVELRKTWWALRKLMSDAYSAPLGVTTEKIHEAARLLGLKLGTKQ